MGWGYGKLQNGKEVGYTVEARCEHPGCKEEIDRGLSYVCGDMHGEDEYSCDGYFCRRHKQNYLMKDDGSFTTICDACRVAFLESGEWIEDEAEGFIFRAKE